MKTKQMQSQVADRMVKAAGSVAGTVADPKTGWKMAVSAAIRPRVLLVAAAVLAAYAVGRTRSRHSWVE